MRPTTILQHIRGLRASGSSEHLESINDAFLKGTLRQPVRAMSDHDPARAIREFRALPVSDGTITRLSRRLLEAPRGG